MKDALQACVSESNVAAGDGDDNISFLIEPGLNSKTDNSPAPAMLFSTPATHEEDSDEEILIKKPRIRTNYIEESDNEDPLPPLPIITPLTSPMTTTLPQLSVAEGANEDALVPTHEGKRCQSFCTPAREGPIRSLVSVCMSVCLYVTKINFGNFLNFGSYDLLNFAQ